MSGFDLRGHYQALCTKLGDLEAQRLRLGEQRARLDAQAARLDAEIGSVRESILAAMRMADAIAGALPEPPVSKE